ncbi:transcriptional regulator [Alkalibaculum sp. M08DMB]|uniref:protein acetyllysine N-acetyltransferase n=1 Tax=Alkalibaculum sporogenes TaxID=2655001 RepID=A0A6A7KBU4_9FIRM|nr:Sir2 family NAD-dependent protein deacetylase [Alkalibaculum sporogenes]MPW26884.1 transcriptional regulator [Alkalibaculum sporogenes]
MKIAALTGAGVSRASGVPTFVEMVDLRDKLSRSYFNSYPKEFYKLLNEMNDIINAALPNSAHISLAQWSIPIVTMNIDGLHHRAGSRQEDVIEIHGSLRKVSCPKCNSWFDFIITKESLYCPKCKVTILQPDIVLYEDNIPRLYDAIDIVTKAEVLLIIGTSFYTSTASYISEAAKDAGVKVKIINENAEEEVPKLLESLKTRRN